MFRLSTLFAAGCIAALLGSQPLLSGDKKPEKPKGAYLTAEEAGPDFKVQGEYEGAIDGKGKLGAQIVALGNGKFDLYVLGGGLPGAGWDQKLRVKVPGKTADGVTSFTDKKWTAEVKDGKLSGKTPEGEAFALKRVERQSPTVGAKAPTKAEILFEGKMTDAWKPCKLVEDNLLFCGTTSTKKVAPGKLHLEFRTPFEPTKGGQGRGNSGVYIYGQEIQVLDSFGLKGENNECGGYYGSAKPLVNMCLPPLTWQTYDVEIKAGDKGEALLTVYHNGVKIHDNHTIKSDAAKGSTIHFQNHGNHVVFRNIWFVPAEK